MRKLFVLSLSLAAATLAVAAEKKPTIAVIPKGTTHEFWKSVHAGALQAGQELGVEILWKGPLREDDREDQIKVVEDMITRGVAGIVLAPLDDTALRAPVANAVRAGIPVVIIDSDLKSDKHVSFVATDNKRGGYLGGQQLVALLGGAGRVVMLRYQEGSASTANREQGFLDAMKEHPHIEVVSANQYGGATTETAYKASENLLARFKAGEGKLGIDGIFCPNESTTFGMLRALQDGGSAGKVKFVGFDASSKLVEALKQGEIHALVVQNPVRMGYLGVKTMVHHLRGQKVERRVDTGVAVVTRDNMTAPSAREVLAPDLSILGQ
jgi:ribose transport system substrate-binding protein